MNEHRDSRRENESIANWIERISYKDSGWIKKVKMRRKFRWYYDIKFYIQLKLIIFKKKFK
jgi:hypothetical protein|tara:strand:- start:228 stop:410 length:183 start_codon:yes stop_codon:yes gene_type:complete